MVVGKERQPTPTPPSVVRLNLDPKAKKVFSPTANSSPIVHPYGGPLLNLIKGKISHQKHFLVTLIHQKFDLCSFPPHNKDSFRSFILNRANVKHEAVSHHVPTHQDTLSHISGHQNNRYRKLKWASTNSLLT